MSRSIREVSRTIATATMTKLATARQRIHEAVERSPIRLAITGSHHFGDHWLHPSDGASE